MWFFFSCLLFISIYFFPFLGETRWKGRQEPLLRPVPLGAEVEHSWPLLPWHADSRWWRAVEIPGITAGNGEGKSAFWSSHRIGAVGLEGMNRVGPTSGFHRSGSVWQCGHEAHQRHTCCSSFLHPAVDLVSFLGVVFLLDIDLVRKGPRSGRCWISSCLCILPNQTRPTKAMDLSSYGGTLGRVFPRSDSWKSQTSALEDA